jgi:uncharacterized protein with HEPN domain
VIGEAAGKISATTKATHPKILWREIIGMRHRLIHGYGTSASILFGGLFKSISLR